MEKEIKLEEKCTTGAPKKKKMSRKRKTKRHSVRLPMEIINLQEHRITRMIIDNNNRKTVS